MFGKKKRAFYAEKSRLIKMIEHLSARDFTISTSIKKGHVALFPSEKSNLSGIKKGHSTLCDDGSKKYTLKLPRTSYLGHPIYEYSYDSYDPQKCELTEDQYNEFINTVKGCDRIETKAYIMKLTLINEEVIAAYEELAKKARIIHVGMSTDYYTERYSISKLPVEAKPYSSIDCANAVAKVKKHIIKVIESAEY